MSTRFTPEKAQQRTPLFRYSTKPLPFSTGVFSRDESDITSQGLAIREPPRIAQEYVRCQRRDLKT